MLMHMTMTEPPTPMRSARSPVARLRDTQRRLQAECDVPTLLARAAEEARGFCDADRALVLRVGQGGLSAAGIAAIAHEPSDALRRAVLLAHPVEIVSGTPEAEHVRHAEGAREARPTRPSALAQLLELEQPAIGVAAPEGRALALIVVDRPLTAAAAELDQSVALFAHLLGCALDRAVHRARMDELTKELRHLTTSAQALMQEAAHAPLTLPEDYGNGLVFRQVSAAPAAADDMRAVLTDRENDVMRLVVEGLSNRRIGEELFLSPATVKDHVARILGKLGAANRVDAVGIYLGLARRR
jgi:DNA-binding CsgD family transcriptional regulator